MNALLLLLFFAVQVLSTSKPAERQVEITIHTQEKVITKTVSVPQSGKISIKSIVGDGSVPVCDPTIKQQVKEELSVPENVTKLELKTMTVAVQDMFTGSTKKHTVCEGTTKESLLERIKRGTFGYKFVDENVQINPEAVIQVYPENTTLSTLTVYDPVNSKTVSVMVATKPKEPARRLKMALHQLSSISFDLLVLCDSNNNDLLEFTSPDKINLPNGVVVEYNNKKVMVPTCQKSTAKFCKETGSLLTECDRSLMDRLEVLMPELKGKRYSLSGLDKADLSQVMDQDYEPDVVNVVVGEGARETDEEMKRVKKNEKKLKRNKKVTTWSLVGASVIVVIHLIVISAMIWCCCHGGSESDQVQ